MTKIIIALIHNNDKKRNDYLYPMLDKLKKALSKKSKVEVVKISEQPKIHFQDTLVTIVRKCFLWKINREWLSYREIKSRPYFVDIPILLLRCVRVYLQRVSENRRFGIDVSVTYKHTKAWETFLEKKADILICFEDDVVFKKDSVSRMESLLSEIEKVGNKPIYLDLAGGLDNSFIRTEKLLVKTKKDYKYYKKPVTNTSCGYMINQKTAEEFKSVLIKFPWFRGLPIDWLVNKIFISTVSKRYHCFHTEPTVFNHGSLTGNYSSWLWYNNSK